MIHNQLSNIAFSEKQSTETAESNTFHEQASLLVVERSDVE